MPSRHPECRSIHPPTNRSTQLIARIKRFNRKQYILSIKFPKFNKVLPPKSQNVSLKREFPARSKNISRSCVVVNASGTQSDNQGSILGRGSPVNEAVHPSGVDKLVRTSRQLHDHCGTLRIFKAFDHKLDDDNANSDVTYGVWRA